MKQPVCRTCGQTTALAGSPRSIGLEALLTLFVLLVIVLIIFG